MRDRRAELPPESADRRSKLHILQGQPLAILLRCSVPDEGHPIFGFSPPIAERSFRVFTGLLTAA
jgi:hypothetical protein